MTDMKPRDPEELRKMLWAFAQGQQARRPMKKRGRPKGTRYIGDIDRSRCVAVDAARYILYQENDPNALDYTDPQVVDIVQAWKNSGKSDGTDGLIFELLCSEMVSRESVLVSIRKGWARIRRRKK